MWITSTGVDSHISSRLLPEAGSKFKVRVVLFMNLSAIQSIVHYLRRISMTVRVLLVDDEKDFVDSLSERLRLRSFHVHSAYSGEEALDVIRHHQIDVVVLDVIMPGLNGIETYKEIKILYPRIRVIMLTGHAKLDTAIEGMEEGAYDYLIKPISIEELVEKIEMAHSHKAISDEKETGS
jgi:DNA-binding NtrC family response regulator